MQRLAHMQSHLAHHECPAAWQPAPAAAVSGSSGSSSGSTRVGFGIIGAGSIAVGSFAPALLESHVADLVAVCRRNEGQAKAFATEHGAGCAAYGSGLELLQDPAVEAVLVATPTHTHKELTILAAQHGKHVLVEKPMARDAHECRDMIAACAEAGVALGVCYRRRTFPQVVKAKELVAEGAIGEVLTVRTHCSSLQAALKADGAEMALARGDPAETFSDAWTTEPVLGGAMMEMASHRIEVMLNFMDLVPRDVTAMVETNHPDHMAAGWQEKGVDDSDAILVRFDGGKLGIHTTMLTTPPRRDMAYIEGTTGRIMIDSLESGNGNISLETSKGGRKEIQVEPLPAKLFDMPMIDDFGEYLTTVGRATQQQHSSEPDLSLLHNQTYICLLLVCMHACSALCSADHQRQGQRGVS